MSSVWHWTDLLSLEPFCYECPTEQLLCRTVLGMLPFPFKKKMEGWRSWGWRSRENISELELLCGFQVGESHIVKEILLDRNKVRQTGVEHWTEELKMCEIIEPIMEGEES